VTFVRFVVKILDAHPPRTDQPQAEAHPLKIDDLNGLNDL